MRGLATALGLAPSDSSLARRARRHRRARRLAGAGHRQPRQARPGPDPARPERDRRGDRRHRRRLLDDAAQGQPGRRRGAGRRWRGSMPARSATLHQAMLHAEERDGSALGARVVRAAVDVRRDRRRARSRAIAGRRRSRRDPARIAATFAADRGLMLAEAAVFALAARMPRPEAQALVSEAVKAADRDGTTLGVALVARAPDMPWAADPRPGTADRRRRGAGGPPRRCRRPWPRLRQLPDQGTPAGGYESRVQDSIAVRSGPQRNATDRRSPRRRNGRHGSVARAR